MIEIRVNGEKKEVEENINIKELLELFNYGKNAFAVALNANLIPLEKYAEVKLNAGDEIEVLSPVQGG